MNTQETTREGMPDRDGKGAVTDEQVLVMQAKSGYSSAFGELYERHRLKLYRSAFRILRNPQNAEDAVQQSFWMTRIAINEALMMLRRRRVTTTFFETNNGDINRTSLDRYGRPVQPRSKPSPRKKVVPL